MLIRAAESVRVIRILETKVVRLVEHMKTSVVEVLLAWKALAQMVAAKKSSAVLCPGTIQQEPAVFCSATSKYYTIELWVVEGVHVMVDYQERTRQQTDRGEKQVLHVVLDLT